ncbi:MAG: FlgO family outer membrane protein [Gemmatimonadales bacterium]|nr:FlgO family outer membrane protein [Gemmatimonadales bacterium]
MTFHDELQRSLGTAYTIERELGGGGMSRVWLATEAALDRQVVVKVIAAELSEGLSAERFAREVRLAARLQHANIVPVLTTGTADGLPYYTMPFVAGESLRGRMAGGQALGVGESVAILRDVARALAYAHSQGVVHRDIKPENVLLSHGAAMVTDFGIAKALTASRTQTGTTPATLTQAGGAIGTPAYMAPEQAVGEAVDNRTDLYAWGVMAYEMLAGAHPFGRHSTPQRLITAHLTESPPSFAEGNPAIPPGLVALVMQCLEKDPARRPASAADVLAGLDGATTPVPSLRPAPSTKRRRVGPALVVVALAVVALVAWIAWPRAGPIATSPGADQSLAVLPLANLSGDQSDDYFGIGLAEEITRALAQKGVRVIGRVSAGALLAQGLDERAIARQLGVGSLLTGTVQRADGQVRINVSLVSAADGAVRWTDRYDRPLTNVFAVQDEIARTVATTLLGSLGRAPAGAAMRVETADPEAHALFLQGQVLFNRRGGGALQQAIVLFQRAAARDPKYARAQASLAMALAVLPAYVQDSSPEILASAVAAANRAIAMDSTIPESYAALGYGYSILGELRRADESFRRALALDSTLATTWGWYGLLAGRLGDYAAAHDRIARGAALEPAALISRLWEAQTLAQERRFAEADSVASMTIAADSAFMLAWEWRANALLGMGDPARAIALLERQIARSPGNRVTEALGLLAYAFAIAGRPTDARAMIDSVRARSGGRTPALGVLAAALAELGDLEAAVTLLGRAIDRHDVWVVQFPLLARYDRLRRDPRAAAMLARLRTL